MKSYSRDQFQTQSTIHNVIVIQLRKSQIKKRLEIQKVSIPQKIKIETNIKKLHSQGIINIV